MLSLVLRLSRVLDRFGVSELGISASAGASEGTRGSLFEALEDFEEELLRWCSRVGT